VPRNGDEAEKAKEPPQPPVRGFYGLLTGTVYGVSTDPSQVEASNDPGVAGGIRLGYRVATILGLEGMFQYGRAGGDGAIDGTNTVGSFVTESLRIGPNLRLMTKGKTLRFVGTIGAGLAYDSLTFSGNLTSLLDDPEGAVSAYLLLEPAIELQIGHLILGAALPIMPTSSQGGDTADSSGSGSANTGDSFSSALAQIGFQLRVGYGSW
jgi:hypothetical protein